MAQAKNNAEMKQGGVAGGFGLGVGFWLALVVVVLLLRGFKATVHHLLPPTAPQSIFRGRGGVTIRGGIMGMQVSSMRADVAKNPGDPITVVITWTQGTENAQGTPIAWPFVVDFGIQKLTGGPFVLQVCDSGQGCATQSQQVGVHTTTITGTIPATGLAPGDRLLVSAAISALPSDDEGNPTGTTTVLINAMQATDQIVIGGGGGGGGMSIPGGSVGNIELSQRRYGGSLTFGLGGGH